MTYIYTILWDDIKPYWEIDGQTWCNITPILLIPYLITAIVEFQILRVLFFLFPYDFLALNDALAYPLAVSVPVLTALGQIFTYLYSRTLCDNQLIHIYLFKLNDVKLMDGIIILSVIKIKMIILFEIVFCEFFLRINMYCWSRWRNRNRIFPDTNHQPADNQYNHTKELSMLMSLMIPIVMLVFMFVLVFGMNLVFIYIFSVVMDMELLFCPIYWLVSTQEIITYVKLKLSQIKLKLGIY